MLWVVNGADASTGEDRAIRVVADTRAAAESKARAQGLLVSQVIAVPDPELIAYHGPSAGAPEAPVFDAISRVAFRIAGFGCLLGTGMCLVGTVLTVNDMMQPSYVPKSLWSTLMGVCILQSLGAILLGVGAVFEGLARRKAS